MYQGSSLCGKIERQIHIYSFTLFLRIKEKEYVVQKTRREQKEKMDFYFDTVRRNSQRKSSIRLVIVSKGSRERSWYHHQRMSRGTWVTERNIR